MSFTIGSWKNFASSLWQKEAIQKMDEHVAVTDENGDLLDPMPNPHEQYFHLINDTAWAGMQLTTPQLLVPGDVVAPYQTATLPAWKLVSNLTAGTIVIPQADAGLYQLNMYFTFQASSNGGTFDFTLFANGAPTTATTQADLSNQSDIGNGTIVLAFLIDVLVSDMTLDVRFEAGSKSITMNQLDWTMYRVFPPLSTL